jgi:hypothetical protein
MWTRSSSRLVIAVTAVLVVSLVAGAGAVSSARAPTPSSAPAQFDGGAVSQQGIDTDSVRLIVSIDENGSTTWTVQYWTRLDDENTTAAFESLQGDIESRPSNFTDRFASRMRSTVRTAENATDREMNATGFAVRAERRTPPDYGVIVYTFRWNGFAAVDGETIRVGDAIEGLFLDERTRLVIEWPTGYATTDVDPTPDERRNDAVVWRGAETSFVSGEPSVVLGPATTPTAGSNGSGGDGDATTPTQDGGSGSLLPLLAVGLLVLGAVAWRYRDRFGDRAETGVTTEGDGDAGGAPASPSGRDDLLSNEERVLQFVREQGGRVKQQEIVEAFDWTEARTSQIVRDLRDDGSLEGFRLGRENVLKLPDEES